VDGRTDGHLRPTLSGRLGGVNLIIRHLYSTLESNDAQVRYLEFHVHFQHKYGYIRVKKLKPGLVASYNIRPGNRVGVFW